MKHRSGGANGREFSGRDQHERSAGKQNRSRVQRPDMAHRKMPGPPQLKGHAPLMRAMQQRGRGDGRPSGLRGGPPWMMSAGRSADSRNGPPWMRGQMQHEGQRRSGSQSQRMNEGQHSQREHRGGPDGPRRGAGEGDGPGGPDGHRRGGPDGPGRGGPDGPGRGGPDGPGRGER